MTLLLVFYLIVSFQRSVLLTDRTGGQSHRGVLSFPSSAHKLIRELLFGARTEQMAKVLEAEGGLPVDNLPRTPAGRIVRAAADQEFEKYRAETEAAPDDCSVLVPPQLRLRRCRRPQARVPPCRTRCGSSKPPKARPRALAGQLADPVRFMPPHQRFARMAKPFEWPPLLQEQECHSDQHGQCGMGEIHPVLRPAGRQGLEMERGHHPRAPCTGSGSSRRRLEGAATDPRSSHSPSLLTKRHSPTTATATPLVCSKSSVSLNAVHWQPATTTTPFRGRRPRLTCRMLSSG